MKRAKFLSICMVIVFLFAAFVAAALFGVNSFKNEDDGEGV